MGPAFTCQARVNARVRRAGDRRLRIERDCSKNDVICPPSNVPRLYILQPTSDSSAIVSASQFEALADRVDLKGGNMLCEQETRRSTKLITDLSSHHGSYRNGI